MIYELWDIGTANLVGSFDTERQALDAVCAAVSRHGKGIARPWALTTKNIAGDGETLTLARGAALVSRALRLTTAS